MATLIVPPYPGNRAHAVRQLVRPSEVAQFIRPKQFIDFWDLYTFAEDVAAWQAARLAGGETRYLSDGVWDAWQSPEATLRRRGGDCEDHAILLLSLLAHDAEVSAYFVVGQYWNGRNWSGHAWVEGRDSRGGFMIEATSGEVLRGARPERYRVGQNIFPDQTRRAA